jgi:hypothetical protein
MGCEDAVDVSATRPSATPLISADGGLTSPLVSIDMTTK